ncbi:MAG: FG-GAP-like repeat-containing protein [Acidobacteriota bacterium]
MGAVRLPGFRFRASFFLIGMAAARLQAASCPSTVFRQAPTTVLSGPAVSSADVNGDGLVDLASTSSSGNQPAVAVFLSAGDGTFDSPVNRIVPNGYSTFVLGDFDGDGKPDLVAKQGQYLAFFKGNGNGTFQDEIDTNFPNYVYSRAIYARDPDGDGKLDLLERLDGATTLFYKGKGNGAFFDPVIATPLALTDHFAIADLDADGKLDLVIPSGGSVGVLRGNGDGTFGAPAYYVAGPSAGSVVAGDFDGDGKIDLAVTVTGHLAFLKGLGDASFLASIEYDAGPSPGGAIAADFDGDSKLDVAVANGDSFSTPASNVSILYGDGAGSFSAPVGYIAPGSSGLLAADLTGDGAVDLARLSSTCCYFNSVTVLINDGNRSFETAGATGVGLVPNVLAAGDFDGDGRLDLAVAESDQSFPALRIVRGGRAGVFEPGAVLPAGDYPVALAAGDLNTDGKLDLVVTNYYDTDFQVFLGNGNGTFQVPISYPLAQPFAGNAGALAVRDFDGDGKLDVVAAASFGSNPANLQFFHGLGDGTFSSSGSGQPLEFFPWTFAVSDLNGDGLPDLIASQPAGYSNPNYVMVLLGNGDGTFAPPVNLLAGTSPGSVAIGDFDEDGSPDLAVANGASANVSILFGNGDGTFAPAVQIGLASDPVSIVAFDFDGDGHLDFATANGQDGGVFVATGLGNGTFRSPVRYALGSYAYSLAAGDWDATGSTDLAVGLGSVQIAVLFNTRLAVSAPSSLSVCGGAGATFEVAASGFRGVQYQWRKNGAPLADEGNVSGATSAILSLAPTTASDAGSYDVLVTDACGSLVSASALLAVPAKPATPSIAAPTSVPPGSTGVTASVPAVAGHSYLWSLTGGSITGGQGTHVVTFTAGPAGTTMSLEVVESLSASCSSEAGKAKVQVDFLDVPPSHLFHDAIVSIARAGITSGCGAGRYCPELPVSRSSMSVFILRGEHGAAFVPPDATGAVFSDVMTSTFLAKWIEQLGVEGISTGCGGGNFCPNDAVNRASMAVFLLRGKYGSSYDPPAATGTVFADVQPGTFLAKWMEKLKLDGITSGCGGGNYCPNGTVSRGEMAALVRKTFGI